MPAGSRHVEWLPGACAGPDRRQRPLAGHVLPGERQEVTRRSGFPVFARQHASCRGQAGIKRAGRSPGSGTGPGRPGFDRRESGRSQTPPSGRRPSLRGAPTQRYEVRVRPDGRCRRPPRGSTSPDGSPMPNQTENQESICPNRRAAVPRAATQPAWSVQYCKAVSTQRSARSRPAAKRTTLTKRTVLGLAPRGQPLCSRSGSGPCDCPQLGGPES